MYAFTYNDFRLVLGKRGAVVLREDVTLHSGRCDVPLGRSREPIQERLVVGKLDLVTFQLVRFGVKLARSRRQLRHGSSRGCVQLDHDNSRSSELSGATTRAADRCSPCCDRPSRSLPTTLARPHSRRRSRRTSHPVAAGARRQVRLRCWLWSRRRSSAEMRPAPVAAAAKKITIQIHHS